MQIKGGACHGKDKGYRRDNVKAHSDSRDAFKRAVASFVYHLACLPVILYFRPQKIISYFSQAFKSYPLTTSVTVICKWGSLISEMFHRAAPPKFLSNTPQYPLEKQQRMSPFFLLSKALDYLRCIKCLKPFEPL